MKNALGVVLIVLVVYCLGVLSMTTYVAWQDIKTVERETQFVDMFQDGTNFRGFVDKPQTLLLTPRLTRVELNAYPVTIVPELRFNTFYYEAKLLPHAFDPEAIFTMSFWGIDVATAKATGRTVFPSGR